MYVVSKRLTVYRATSCRHQHSPASSRSLVHGYVTCTGIFRLYAYASIPRFKGNDVLEMLR